MWHVSQYNPTCLIPCSDILRSADDPSSACYLPALMTFHRLNTSICLKPYVFVLVSSGLYPEQFVTAWASVSFIPYELVTCTAKLLTSAVSLNLGISSYSFFAYALTASHMQPMPLHSSHFTFSLTPVEKSAL